MFVNNSQQALGGKTMSSPRIIKTYEVHGADSHITVTADERDPVHGNASHNYTLQWQIEREGKPFEVTQLLQFQHGPINEVGVNGITNEILLAIIRDRLEGFQAGNFACTDTAEALKFVQLSLEWLKIRTENRVARGVEGKNLK